MRQVTSERSCPSSDVMEGLEAAATAGVETSVILTAATLVPRELRSTKVGISLLTFADSMDHVGVHQLSGRGALWQNYRANTVGH